MRRARTAAVLGLLCLLVLAGCGGAPHASPARSSSPSPSPVSRSSAPAPAPAPTTTTATTVRWRLPVPSARQAVVPVANGAVVLAGGLLAGDQSTGSAYRIGLQHGRVHPLPPLAVPVHDAAGGLVDGAATVFGGGNASEQSVVQTLHGRAWKQVAHLPTTRSDLSVVDDGSRAVVLGGYDGVHVPRGVLAVTSGSVRRIGRLATGVRYAATGRVGGTVYVFGGEVADQELRSVQAVDLSTGRTTIVGRLPRPLGHAMAATVAGRVLLMGGRVSPDRQTDAVWLFDPATGRFRAAGRLPRPLSDAGVASYGSRVWLLGGEQPLVTDQVVRIRVH